jgi:hypothetical protein
MACGKPVYKCACGTVFKPMAFPHTRRCQCGAIITVNKPVKEKDDEVSRPARTRLVHHAAVVVADRKRSQRHRK